MAELEQLPEDLPESGSIDDKIEIKKEKKLDHTLEPTPIKKLETIALFGFSGPSYIDDPSSPDFIPVAERTEIEQAKWWADYFRRKEKNESIHNDVQFDEPIVENDNFQGFYGNFDKTGEKT